MVSIKDDRGFNQGYKPSKTLEIRTKRRCDYMLTKMDLTRENEILEIGCGLGDLSFYLAQHPNQNVLGTDLCQPFIEQAKTLYNLPNLNYDTLDFNAPEKLNNRKFDYIVGNGILHHLYYQIDTALINLKKLLKPGGKIIFLEPNLLNPYCFLIFNTSQFFRNLAHLEPTEKAFTKTFITKQLIKATYTNIEIEYKDFLLPIIPYFLVKPVVAIGNVVEKIPVLKCITQSIYICANK